MSETDTSAEHLERLLICLAGLGDMAAEITGTSTIKASMRSVLRMIKGTFAISRGAILLYQADTKRLSLLSALGVDERALAGVAMQSERFWCDDLAREFWLGVKGPVRLDELKDEPALNGFFLANKELFSALPNLMWVPLVVRGEFLGLLLLSEKLGGQMYSETEADLLGVIGRQIAVALFNQELSFKLQIKLVERERLNEISKIIHSSLNRQTIVRELVGQAVSLLNARRGILVSFDSTLDEFEYEAGFGVNAWPSGTRFKLQQLWLEEVVTTGEGRIWDDPLEIPAELDSFCCVAVPIFGRDRVTGVLAVFDKEAAMGISSFSVGDRQLLSSLANQAAASMENARLYELATVDGLTKLFIRRHFEQRFGEETRRALRYGSPLSLMMIDIDFFKKFNDTYGHSTGDEVLKLVAQTIRKSVREDLDIPARFGGEEMMVLMPETGADGGLLLAERIRQAIEDTDLPGPNGEVLHVTVSIGVATLPDHAMTEDGLMELADQALYHSKRTGRNRVTQYSTEMAAQEVP